MYKNLTIYTCVSGWYRHYIPLFKYCAEKAYPGATVVVEFFADPPVPYYAACRRLFADIGTTEYTYVTDVDMMLHGGLVENHLAWMESRHVCYSNTTRGKGEPNGYKRLTGLHFASREWYVRTAEQRSAALDLLEKGKVGLRRFQDEYALYNIAKDSGLPVFDVRRPLTAWHFGIHMGTLRCYKTATRQKKNSQLDRRVTPQEARWWVRVTEDPRFQRLALQACQDCLALKEQYSFLHSYVRRRAKC